MLMMRQEPFAPRSFITIRNQQGYGTQKNWMAVRQEWLYYTKGSPLFNIEAEYTDIPKILRGYYKEVNGNRPRTCTRQAKVSAASVITPTMTSTMMVQGRNRSSTVCSPAGTRMPMKEASVR